MGEAKSPRNENIKVNVSQVRNLLPLTPTNSYKTPVLSCPRLGTWTPDFIKLGFPSVPRPLPCAGSGHHFLLSGLVHFPGRQGAGGAFVLLHGPSADGRNGRVAGLVGPGQVANVTWGVGDRRGGWVTPPFEIAPCPTSEA